MGDCEDLVGLPAVGVPVTENEVSATCGLLASLRADPNFRHRRKVLERLSKFLDDNGIQGGIDLLKGTARGSQLVTHLDNMGNFVRRVAASAAAFKRAPSFYFRCPTSEREWWQALTLEEMEQMLAEVEPVSTSERLTVSCTNALNQPQLNGEPHVVADSPQIEVRHPSGHFQSLSFSRKNGRRQAESLVTSGVLASVCFHTDSTVPTHDSVLTYIAEDTGVLQGSIFVVSLAHFSPSAFFTCAGSGTAKIGRTRRARPAAAGWEQQIELRSGGTRIFRAYCAPEVERLRIQDPQRDVEVIDGTADVPIEIDEDVDIVISLLDVSGQSLSTITLNITLSHEDQELALSFFDALVRTHQAGRSEPLVAKAEDSWLRRAENELLNKQDSWMPVLACPGWSNFNPCTELSTNRVLGSTIPQVEPRPQIDPNTVPDDFMATREQVCKWLQSKTLQFQRLTYLAAMQEVSLRYILKPTTSGLRLRRRVPVGQTP